VNNLPKVVDAKKLRILYYTCSNKLGTIETTLVGH